MSKIQRLKFLTIFVQIAVVIVLLLSGCKDGNTGKEINDFNAVIDQLVPEAERSLEEIKKLQQIEYRVVTISAAASAPEITVELNKQGLQGWDCFHLEKKSEPSGDLTLHFYCKRPVETPLRYLPKGILGGG